MNVILFCIARISLPSKKKSEIHKVIQLWHTYLFQFISFKTTFILEKYKYYDQTGIQMILN